MSIEDDVKLVKDTMEEFMRAGSPARLLAAITEDAVIKAIIADGTPISGEFRGRDGFLRYFEALGEVMEILDQGKIAKVLAFAEMSAIVDAYREDGARGGSGV